MMRLPVLLTLFGTAVQASCPAGEQVFMSCQIEGRDKVLSVCLDQITVTYRFGSPGADPDLTLSDTIADADYTPWPGAGSQIWEEVRFMNNGYSYTVHGGHDRWPDDGTREPPRSYGGVVVEQGDVQISNLSCVESSIDFPWGGGLYDAKLAAGLEWDHQNRRWRKAP